MDSKNIEQLLEKYWNCETSLEEEQQLREYFRGNDFPQQWKEAAELFQYFDNQKKKGLVNTEFDQGVVSKMVEKPKGKSRLMYNIARIAAGLLVVVAATYMVREEVRKRYPSEDTYSDPQMAFEETKKALMMISKGFGKGRKEATKINVFNEAEQKIEGKEPEKKDESSI